MTRFPERPPVAENLVAAYYPMVSLEIMEEVDASDEFGTVQQPATRLTLALHFCCIGANVAAHTSLESPWEYARKGAEAVDTNLDNLGKTWGLADVIRTKWQAAGPSVDESDVEQSFYVYSSAWEVIYGNA